jgi:hypothetical protein
LPGLIPTPGRLDYIAHGCAMKRSEEIAICL